MKAVRIHEFGGPEVLQVEDQPRPQPASDEVLVRVEAASVNPVDYKMRNGGYVPESALPLTLGRDVAGTVEDAGGGPFRAGDAVYAMLGRDRGGYVEFAAVKAADCARMPHSLDFIQAAAVPLAALTAWQGLFDNGHLTARQRVLIHGASGGVGHFAVQLARAKGATVIATCARKDMDFVRGLGASEVIDYQAERFEDCARDIDLVYDLVGGETQDRSWAVLREGGAMVSTLTEPDKAKARAKTARSAHYVAQPNGAQLAVIGQMIDDGKVIPSVARVFPLAEAAKAERQLEDGHVRGKIVLEVQQQV
jgi:NADPH:quinone reductase-like Zn-dependent oxidoreductase